MRSRTVLEFLVTRAERQEVDVAATAYRVDGTCFGAALRNISYDGCLFVADAAVSIGEKLRLAIPRMGEIRAQVRWASNEGKAGAQFVVEEIGPMDRTARFGL
ncbi:MAG: PilZ domain-containing protein [Sphingomicrobium sp.]